MAEEDLSEEINKLEIAASLPLVKLIDKHLPISLNPFYDDGIDAKRSITNSISRNREIFGATKTPADQEYQQGTRSCRKCRIRRSSESVLDDFKLQPTAPLPTEVEFLTNLRTTPRVNKQPMKKSSSSVGRKPVLREPVLRALQTCFHIQSTARRKHLSVNEPVGEHNSVTKSIHDPMHSKGISNFRDLINECETMLQENVNFNSNLNNKSFKKFSTVQGANFRTDDSLLSTSGTIRNSINSTQSFVVSMEPSTSSRTNTTCSQQAASHQCAHSHPHSFNAVGTVGTTDDVTIDELASYFDTLVHIPKKMSSMAEMMYI